MKFGKKILLLVTSLALMIGLFTISAAAGYTDCADSLNQMGLLKGGDNGYDLDRAPSRSEAAVMMVRFLGQENTALTGYADGTYTDPFTDQVPSWADPYVAYLYTIGLTKGTGATTFSPSASCTAQQYAIFLLRALGYTEAAGDFTYDKALAFAAEKGILDPTTAGTSTFLRGNMAAASYTALGATVKNTTTTLLDKLVTDNVISADTAKPYQTLFANYAKLQKASAASQQSAMDADYSLVMSAKSGDTQIMDMTGKGRFKCDFSSLTNASLTDTASLISALAASQMIMTGNYSVAAGDTDSNLALNLYLKDGVAYIAMDAGTTESNLKVKVDLASLIKDNAGSLDLSNLDNLASLSTNSVSPTYGLALIKSIDVVNNSNGSVTYTVTMDGLNDYIRSIYASMPDMLAALDESGISYSDAVCHYTFDKNGNLSATDMSIGYSMDGAAMGLSDDINYTMNMTLTLDTSGKSSSFTYPNDLSTYVDIQDLTGTL